MKVVELIEMLMDLPREAMDEEILFTESRPSKACDERVVELVMES